VARIVIEVRGDALLGFTASLNVTFADVSLRRKGIT
jgi:hypothetical protein